MRPGVPDYQQALATVYDNLGLVANDLGQAHEAVGFLRKSVTVQEALAAANPNSTIYRQQLAGRRNSLGKVLTANGRPGDAEVEYRRALALSPVVPCASASTYSFWAL